jgi:hypothetical protein
MIVLHAAHVSTNAPLEQSPRAKSIQLTLISAQNVVLALMHALVVLSHSDQSDSLIQNRLLQINAIVKMGNKFPSFFISSDSLERILYIWKCLYGTHSSTAKA